MTQQVQKYKDPYTGKHQARKLAIVKQAPTPTDVEIARDKERVSAAYNRRLDRTTQYDATHTTPYSVSHSAIHRRP